ncbi:MAG TPA: 50S ribosomal protein L6, partial [Ignavibacteriaceae bacterium]|nr:50S ribosomal protein L6 [Ignavibacteriaceae bacterium]
MSRIGKKIIEIPKGVTVTVTGNTVKVKGPKGELQRVVHNNMKVEMKDAQIEVKRPDDQKENRALHGLTRALIQNMILGVNEEYKKELDIVGVGYKV